MAGHNKFKPQEIPVKERTRHTGYSVGGEVEVDLTHLDDPNALLVDESSLSLDGFDLSRMFKEYNPQQLIQVIERHGVMLLGTMEIDQGLMRREFEGRTTLTVGRDELHMTDWKRMWMDELMGGGKKSDSVGLSDSSVSVEAFVVTIRNAARSGQSGLLYPLIKRWEADACPIEVWGLPTVRALVSYKWNHWARKCVTLQFVLYVCWVLCFIALALNFTDDGALREGSWMVLLVTVAQILMLPFTYLCISRMRSASWQWFNFWNVIDVSTQAMQTVCTVVYFSDSLPSNFFIVLGAQVVLMIAQIQFYARAFVAVDSSMLDTLKAVLGSIRWYLLLLILTVYSFACAFYILYRKSYKDCQDFEDLLHSVMSMFSLMLGEWEIGPYVDDQFHLKFDEFMSNWTNYSVVPVHQNETYIDAREEADEECQGSDVAERCEQNACLWRDTCHLRDLDCAGWLTYRPTVEVFSIVLFLCLYMVLMSILFYHLLIAMVIDAHGRQMDVKKLWVHLSRAEIINILETALPRRFTEHYAVPYIHVLRVIPTRAANLDKLWNQADNTEHSVTQAADRFDQELKEIESDIMSRIEGISERIRTTIGVPEKEYKDMVFRKMGIAQMRKMTSHRSFRLTASSRKLLSESIAPRS